MPVLLFGGMYGNVEISTSEPKNIDVGIGGMEKIYMSLGLCCASYKVNVMTKIWIIALNRMKIHNRFEIIILN